MGRCLRSRPRRRRGCLHPPLALRLRHAGQSRRSEPLGGQRQRIGLARALLKNAEILILDEATNAVDGLSEREIMKLLAQRRYFRTAVVVSHRPLTLEACEDGIVLDEGRVVEAGPLRSLDYYRLMTNVAPGASARAG